MLQAPEKLRRRVMVVALLTALAGGGPAFAQILGGRLPGLPGGLPSVVPDLPRVSAPPLAATADGLTAGALTDLRRLTVQKLLREHRDIVEADDHGQPVVRGEVLALGVGPETLDRLRQAGFSIRVRDRLPGLDLESVTLGVPRGMSAAEAIRRARVVDPAAQYDFDHLYQESGAVTGAADTPSPPGATGRALRVGMVDGSVTQSRPALAHTELVQRAFAPGGARATAHATAVASLIARAAPSAEIFVADVYGPTPLGGSALALARALDWLAQSKTPVVNVSLVGPHNLLLAAAVKAAMANGMLLVAPVGNDGPAAPPLYPAAYPGVIAVTGVDVRRRVLPEAGHAGHVDFAAPGAEVSAAATGGGFVSVRGTSFAAPIVAGLLAASGARAGPAQAVQALAREAIDLGAPGPDAVYGQGLVGFDLRTPDGRKP
jgi:hypothetical protein